MKYAVALGVGHGERGRSQCLFAALALGDVRGDTAYRVRATRGVDQRELVRQIGPRSLCGLDDLLEFNRSPLVYDLAIVAAKFRRRRGKQIAIQATNDRGDRNTLDSLELAVDKQESPIEILDEHRGRRVIDDLLQLSLCVIRNGVGGQRGDSVHSQGSKGGIAY